MGRDSCIRPGVASDNISKLATTLSMFYLENVGWLRDYDEALDVTVGSISSEKLNANLTFTQVDFFLV